MRMITLVSLDVTSGVFEFIDHNRENQWKILFHRCILGNVLPTEQMVARLSDTSEQYSHFQWQAIGRDRCYLTNCSSINDESHSGLMCDRSISQRPFKHLSRSASDVNVDLAPVSASLPFLPFCWTTMNENARLTVGDSYFRCWHIEVGRLVGLIVIESNDEFSQKTREHFHDVQMKPSIVSR